MTHALLALVMLLVLPHLSYALTYYVAPSPTGNNANSCVQARNVGTPKQTLSGSSGALACLAASDTLILGCGTYDEEIANGTIPSGTSSALTTLRATTNRCAIIRPAANRWAIYMGISAQNYIRFDGLVLDGSRGSTGKTGGLRFINGTGNVFENGEIRNTYGDNSNDTFHGMLGLQNFTVRGTYFHDIGVDDVNGSCSSCYAYAIYAGSNNLIEHNEFRRASKGGWAIHFWTSSGLPGIHDNIVRNNLFVDSGGVLVCGSTGSNNQWYNNVLWRLGFSVSSYATSPMEIHCNTNKIYNNTIVAGNGNPNGAIWIRDNGNDVRNNIIYANTNNTIKVDETPNTLTANTLGSPNPLFTNQSGGDFHLLAGSPAIDAGVNVGLPYNGSAPDRGAYETGGDIPPPPPAYLSQLPPATRLRVTGGN